MTRTPLRFFLASLLVAVAFACTEVGTSPTTPVSLAFDTLPSPSVVYGDTLRDINGVAAKLTAHAYNADGNEIVDAPVTYLFADGTTATVDANGYLIATTDTSKKVISIRAQVGGITSITPRTLQIVYSPDTVDRGNGISLEKEDTLTYAGTDTAALLTGTLSLRVLDRPNPAKPDSGLRGVRAYLVRYSVVKPAGADTLLVNDAARRSSIDTTGDDGVASRKIRLRGNLAAGVPDTVIVEASARNREGILPGAPIRYLIILRKSP